MSDAIERLVGLVDVKKHEEPADAVGRALELIHFDFKRSMKIVTLNRLGKTLMNVSSRK